MSQVHLLEKKGQQLLKPGMFFPCLVARLLPTSMRSACSSGPESLKILHGGIVNSD